MKFLIQTINGEIKHDFSFTLIESITYQNWLRGDNSFEYVLSDEITTPDCIPIGSVEFVSQYIKHYFNLDIKPINIPNELIGKEFTNRDVFNGTDKDINCVKFIKSNDKIKSFTEISDYAPKGNYQISDLIEIESEYRAFVYKGELVGLKNYSGDFTKFPDIDKIKKMISAYESQPIAFTLDVAISNNETVIIEVHDFFSCGLYGFAEHKILPYMFSKWFYNYVKILQC